MDLDLLRSIITVISLGCFVAICAWAWSARAQERFAEAARIPFIEEDRPQASGKGQAS